MSWLSEAKWLAILIFAKDRQDKRLIAKRRLLAKIIKPKKRSRPDKRTREMVQLKKFVEEYREDNKKRKQKLYGK